jgi:hypothetical protein
MQEELGGKLMPILNTSLNFLNDSFLPALKSMSIWFSENSKWIGVAAGAIGGALAVWGAYTGILAIKTSLWAAAQWALNLAMNANPIGLIIGGIAALVGGIIVAWNTFEGFRKVVYGLWGTIKQVFTNIGAYFKQIFNPIFEAIQAFKEGRFIDAAKSLGKISLDPSVLANGLAQAYEDGAKKGIRAAKKEEDKLAMPGGLSPSALGQGEGVGQQSKVTKSEVDKIQSRQPSNVYINIDAIIKGDVNNVISNVNNPQNDLNNFLVTLENALLGVVNDVNLVLK